MATKTKSVLEPEHILTQLVGAMLERHMEDESIGDEIESEIDNVVDVQTREVMDGFLAYLSDTMPEKYKAALRPTIERLAREAVIQVVKNYR